MLPLYGGGVGNSVSLSVDAASAWGVSTSTFLELALCCSGAEGSAIPFFLSGVLSPAWGILTNVSSTFRAATISALDAGSPVGEGFWGLESSPLGGLD